MDVPGFKGTIYENERESFFATIYENDNPHEHLLRRNASRNSARTSTSRVTSQHQQQRLSGRLANDKNQEIIAEIFLCNTIDRVPFRQTLNSWRGGSYRCTSSYRSSGRADDLFAQLQPLLTKEDKVDAQYYERL